MAVEVEFVIDTEGNPTIGVRGAKGPACKSLTREAEAAFGKVKKTTPTREMSERPVNAKRTNTNKA